ncbi:hypothetical protein, partial [Salmonella enterica]|uniref:hypothetical protein n=1 Tax=Salmonella enterica TaxID=28901 RepID=UPI001C37AC91
NVRSYAPVRARLVRKPYRRIRKTSGYAGGYLLFCVRRRRRYTIHNSFSRQQTLEKHGNQKK